MTNIFEKNIGDFQNLMTAFLVDQGGREAGLLQNTSKDTLHFVKFLRLKEIETSQGVLISKNEIEPPETEEELGKVLGFQCYMDSSKIWDARKRRTSIHIFTDVSNFGEISVYAELCIDKVSRKLAEEKAELWTQIMIENHLPYRFTAKIRIDDGSDFRLEKLLMRPLDENDYFWNNIDQYKNDIMSYYNKNSILVKGSDDEILENEKYLKFIYPKAIKLIFDSKKKLIPQFEKDILNSKFSKWNDILDEFLNY